MGWYFFKYGTGLHLEVVLGGGGGVKGGQLSEYEIQGGQWCDVKKIIDIFLDVQGGGGGGGEESRSREGPLPPPPQMKPGGSTS